MEAVIATKGGQVYLYFITVIRIVTDHFVSGSFAFILVAVKEEFHQYFNPSV